jgi:transposase
MWTPTARREHSRAGPRYPSDLTDAEWRLLVPLLPRPCRQGRRWAWPQREIMNAIFYVLRAGSAWRLSPDSFPPRRAMYRWFARLRDGGPPLLRASRRRWAVVELCFADSGYVGDRGANASRIRVEILRKPKGQVGFTVHARRWVVEWFFALINRNRRLAKDFEASIASAEAFLYAASVMLLLRRSARCR